jgi:hypothetical protein
LQEFHDIWPGKALNERGKKQAKSATFKDYKYKYKGEYFELVPDIPSEKSFPF